MTLADAIYYTDWAMTYKQVLIPFWHNLVTGTPGPYEWRVSDFDAWVNHVVTNGYTVQTISQLYSSL